MGLTAFMIELWAHFKHDIIHVLYYKPDQEPVVGRSYDLREVLKV